MSYGSVSRTGTSTGCSSGWIPVFTFTSSQRDAPRSSACCSSATGCVARPRAPGLYERTKRDLAQREWVYTQNYADAKATVVQEIGFQDRPGGAGYLIASRGDARRSATICGGAPCLKTNTRGISRRRFLQGTAAASLGTAAAAAGVTPAAADPIAEVAVEPHGTPLRGLDLVLETPTAEGRFG